MRTRKTGFALCAIVAATSIGMMAPRAHAAQRNTLSELRATLKGMHADTPLRGSLRVQTSGSHGKGEKARRGHAEVTLQVADQDGLQLRFPASALRKAEAEKDANAGDSGDDKPTPTADLLAKVQPLKVRNMLSAAPMLLRMLHGAQSPTVKDTTLDGKPVRKLVVTFPKAEYANAKIKDYHASMSVWLDADGRPLAYASSVHGKGCKFFMCMSFDQEASGRLALVDGRLVATTMVNQHKQSGLGEDMQTKTTYRFKPYRGSGHP